MKKILLLTLVLYINTTIIAQTGNVGIGTNIPQSSLEIKSDTKTRLTLNSESSSGLSSLAFKTFEGIDSYRGWLWESELSNFLNQSLNLYAYNYSIGTPNYENKDKLYSVRYKNGVYAHQWYGDAVFDTNMSIYGNSFTKLSLIPKVIDSIAKKIEIKTEYMSNPLYDDIIMTYQYAESDLHTNPSPTIVPKTLYSVRHSTNGIDEHTYYGDIFVDNSSLNLTTTTIAQSDINIQMSSAQNLAGDINFTLQETFLSPFGGYVNPLYEIHSNPIYSPSGLGGAHWLYGHVQTNGLSISNDLFTNTPLDPLSKLYVNVTAGTNINAVHLKNKNATTAALKIENQNDYGPAILTKGSVLINTNSAPTHDYALYVKQDSVNIPYGLAVSNGNGNKEWELFVNNNGNLSLYHNSILKGKFDATSGNYASTSDRRLKTNIQKMSIVLPSLMQLLPKSYNYKTDKNSKYNGFLAQDIQHIFPELVTKIENRNEKPTLLVDYAQISVLAIKGLQEQQVTINQLKSQLKEQNKLIHKILKRLDQ